MITRDDQVKILDFGLAKSVLRRRRRPDRAVPTSRPAPAWSSGTFGYMAPEQVRALPVDHRADIFAFGAVLYEMLSGERAFKGETVRRHDDRRADEGVRRSSTPPRWPIPPGLERIVRRCLEKTADLRFQSANDLAFALEALSTIHVVVGDRARPTGGRRSAAGRRAGAARGCRGRSPRWPLLAAHRGAAVRSATGRDRRRRGAVHAHHRAAGEETSPSLSPDGGTVAYAARVGGSWDISVAARRRPQRHGRSSTIPQRDEGGPAFSPDGSLHRVPRVGR